MKSSYLASWLKQFQWSHSEKKLDKAMRHNGQQNIMSQTHFHSSEKYFLYEHFFKNRKQELETLQGCIILQQ